MTKLEQAINYIENLQVAEFFAFVKPYATSIDTTIMLTNLEKTFILGILEPNFYTQCQALANMLFRENKFFNDAQTTTDTTNIGSIADKTDYIVEYEYNEREMKINDDDLTFDVIAKKEVKFKVLTSGREWVSYNLSSGSSTALGYEDFELELISSSSRKYGFMEIDRRHSSKFKQTFRINFIPALKQDEEVEIHLKWITKSLRFIAFEDFENAKMKGKIPRDRTDHMFTKKITELCNRYLLRLVFPKNFPLNSNFSFSAKKNLIIVESEQKRLSNFFKIQKEEVTQKIILELDVIQPIKDVTYGLRWIPPHCNELLLKSFLTKSQIEKILARNK